MDLENFKVKIQAMVSKGHLETAIDQIVDFISKPKEETLCDEEQLKQVALQLKGRFSKFKNDKSKGVLSFEQTEQTYNIILASVLELVDDFEFTRDNERVALSEKKGIVTLFRGRYKNITLIITSVLIIFVVSWLINLNRNHTFKSKNQKPSLIEYVYSNSECYIVTGVATGLYDKLRQVNFSSVSTLPINTKYRVSKKATLPGRIEKKFYFINAEEYGDGWVSQSELKHVGPMCRTE